MRSIALLLGSFLLCSHAFSQDRCGTVEYEKMRGIQKAKKETLDQFERWISQKLRDRTKTFGTQTSQYTIPVVVHVIHNGVGSESNIPDAQILSQLDVMNKDFKRLNADAANTPAEFIPFAGSLDIEFVLAKQDPEGLATTGITRTQGTKTVWTMNDNSELKALSYWPAENYLNLWVTNVAAPLLGYAQLPVSSLPGLEESSNDALTDGVVVHYGAFGSIDHGSFNLNPQFNKGRTATHEVGHFLGLRHIWGDGFCATDFVDDTPFQSDDTSGCPANPQSSCDPNPAKPHMMFQNYMDYTNDACMNIFTVKQFERVTVVLQNSPRRLSLLTSPGASDPTPVANDAGIRQILAPTSTTCGNPVLPRIEVRNYGSNVVTSVQVQLSINAGIIESPTFSGLSLATNEITTLSFNPLNFTPLSSQLVSFQILQTNGTTDGKASNNSLSVQAVVPVSASLPIIEPFNSTPGGWQITNPDGFITWANRVAPDVSPANRAMYMNLIDYQNVGSLDRLTTPAFSISTPAYALLKFDLAYAMFPGETGDNLKVYALPACNPDLSEGILLYDKTGPQLSTSPNTFNPFVPANESQWRKSEVISLTSLTGSSAWQLVFVSRNGYGNNLYLDNVIVGDNVINDVAITGIASPGLVHCIPNPSIQVNIKNFSSSPVTNFQLQRTLNGGSVVTQTFNNSSLGVGEEKSFTVNPVSLNEGGNLISLTVINPNGFSDSSPGNNSISFNSYLDQTTDAPPLRLTFDNPSEKPWLTAIPINATAWQTTGTNKNQSISYRAFTNTEIGEESWFVSPVLDFSPYMQNSLFFDLSYALKVPADDRLRIVGSVDCGAHYDIVLFDQAGSEFAVKSSATEWTPTTNSDWTREFVSIDTLSGNYNVRLAFVTTNAHGNNIYLDNLEIFAGNDTHPPTTTLPYQIYYSDKVSQAQLALTFNLTEKQDVRLQIYSVLGQVVADNILPDTLNQTYYFDLANQGSGIYLFRLQIDSHVSTTKVFIGQ